MVKAHWHAAHVSGALSLGQYHLRMFCGLLMHSSLELCPPFVYFPGECYLSPGNQASVLVPASSSVACVPRSGMAVL